MPTSPVASREVEESLLGYPGVAECAAIGLPDPLWGERVSTVGAGAWGVTTRQALLRGATLKICSATS
ncbi:MAG: hypothetical protein WCG13_13855 [Burkholderiales bacterium]